MSQVTTYGANINIGAHQVQKSNYRKSPFNKPSGAACASQQRNEGSVIDMAEARANFPSLASL